MSLGSRGPSQTTDQPQESGAGAPKPGDAQFRDNNPKAAFGAKKVGIDFLSFPVLMEQAIGMMAGAAKYGAHNYLVHGPSVMTYIAAAFRHLAAFVGGEEYDPHAGEGVKVHHLTAAQNCLHVVRAAQIAGIAFDDRPPAMPPGFIESLAPSVEAIMRNNPDPVARYLADGKRGPGRILEVDQPPIKSAAAGGVDDDKFGAGPVTDADRRPALEGELVKEGHPMEEAVAMAAEALPGTDRYSQNREARERDSLSNAHDRGAVPCKCNFPHDCDHPHCEC